MRCGALVVTEVWKGQVCKAGEAERAANGDVEVLGAVPGRRRRGRPGSLCVAAQLEPDDLRKRGTRHEKHGGAVRPAKVEQAGGCALPSPGRSA